VYTAVLASFIPPVCFNFLIVTTIYVNKNLRLKAPEFTCFYWGFLSLVFEIVGIISYAKLGYDWKYWLFGFFASLLNVLGCIFVIACYSTGAPVGPSGALISSQSILLTIVAAIVNLKVPSWL